MRKVRELSQRDWDQLLTVAAGYLPMTNGDLHQAMARALSAHAALIRTIRDTGVTADLPRGRVTLFVPDGGGMALAFERGEAIEALSAEDDGLEVVEPGAYIAVPISDDDGEIEPDWPDVG